MRTVAVDAREFSRALESVCDIFKSPSLYNEREKCLEALFRFFLRGRAAVHRLVMWDTCGSHRLVSVNANELEYPTHVPYFLRRSVRIKS